MFLDESAFDLEDNDKGHNRRPVATENRYSKNPGKTICELFDEIKSLGDELKNRCRLPH